MHTPPGVRRRRLRLSNIWKLSPSCQRLALVYRRSLTRVIRHNSLGRGICAANYGFGQIMGFLDSLENNLKSLETTQERDPAAVKRAQSQRELDKQQALAAAPYA